MPHLTEGIITSDIASYACVSNEPFVTLHRLYRKVALFPPTVHCCSADTSRIVSSDLRWDGKIEVAVQSVYFVI